MSELHKRGYNRIIVVGHSLGSVIGYDILYYAWSSLHTEVTGASPSSQALKKVEKLAATPNIPDKLIGYRQAQRDFARELCSNGNSWRVTDFVTLGSPLAHAAILLANDWDDLRSKQMARELPTCPPSVEPGESGFSYTPKTLSTPIADHAAIFAATRWTNLYFPCRRIFWGDIVGGPLAPWFGNKVHDIPVHTNLRRGLLSHTLYWTCPSIGEASHIDHLRFAVNLLDK